jgi:beta-lactamase regulating signal transducer with metallopeptidase domain
MFAPVAERRALGFLGSLAVHIVVVALVLWIGPQVSDLVWDDAGDGSTSGRSTGSPFLGVSQVGQAPSQPTRLQQVFTAMAQAPPAPAVRVRLAVERVLDHLWQSTAFALVVGLLALVLRRNRARVRYALWFAASVKFLVPLALVIALGRVLSPSAIDDLAAHPLVAGVREPLASLSRQALWPASATLDLASRDRSGLVLALLWLGGFAAIAAIRLRQWWRLKAVIDGSAPLELPGMAVPDTIDVRATTGLMEPGLVGWQQPVLLMPDGIDRVLSPQEVESIVAHELCHARRLDNLTGAVHMVVEALFWFHPLVWWVGTRLVNERERACDEHVLRTLGHPASYARGIVAVCARYVRSPLACVSGVGASNVRRRLDAILANQVGERIGPLKWAVVATTCVLVMVVPLSVGAMTAPWLPGMAFLRPVAAPLAPPSPDRAASTSRLALALVMARADGAPGPRLRRSRTDCDAMPTTPCGAQSSPGRISASGVTSSELTALVAGAIGHPVLDRTGLEGRFDVLLTWTRSDSARSFAVTDLERQLGLTLVSIDTRDDAR